MHHAVKNLVEQLKFPGPIGVRDTYVMDVQTLRGFGVGGGTRAPG